MSAADVRDVLELPGHSQADTPARRPPAKKQKTVEKRPDGITRELYALLGEHPPPVSLSLKPHFKERPRWLEKAKPWEQRAFVNPARGDGLVLRHWVAKKGLGENREVMNVEKEEGDGREDTVMSGTGDGAAGEGKDANVGGDPMLLDETPPDPDYHFAKFNIKPNILRYTDAEYAFITNTKPKSSSDPNTTATATATANATTSTATSTSTSTASPAPTVVEEKPNPEPEETEPEGWTRSETDYLFSLCEEYDLRSPNTLTPPPPRSLEDLKHRYYLITQSLLSHRTPIHLMTPQEHQFYTLHSFDRAREVSRKRIAETLFNRTPDEIKEEEFLLAEMKRILANQEKLLEERQDLWNRLDAPASAGSITAYMGSAGLGNLGQLVGVGEKGKKRKSIAGGMANIDTSSAVAAAAGGGTPNTAGPTPTTSRPEKKHSHSHSISSISGATLRDLKDPNSTIPSTPSATPQSSTFPPPSAARPLSPQSQAHYGVSYPTEKLGSGVYLRSSKIGTIKGASQPKVQAALNELGVPVKLVMSTEKTCKRMEGLNSVVGMVLDARRLLEKLEGELRVERGRLENLG
ncbi:hypothetical protein BGX38DRAFT_1150485 [Terfezia claveryi]|nr:hypothetical protein BGX38DRAFT_1150485 [Terfezia claveryi]